MKFFLFSLIFVFSVVFFLVFQNYAIKKEKYTLKISNLPKAFQGFKIIHISDLHRKSFGKKQNLLIKSVKASSPNAVIISGDLLYCHNKPYNISFNYNEDLIKIMNFVSPTADLFPTYYAAGNHECKSHFYSTLKDALLKSGVAVLDNEVAYITRGNEKIAVLGLLDPTFYGGTNAVKAEYLKKAEEKLKEMKKSAGISVTLLIAHRPENMEMYAKHQIDAVFSGHAHGGQWRLPFIGGLYAPGQGIFPKYTAGVITMEKTQTVISRGLGNSSFPIRLFNRPCVIEVTLQAD